jgi:DNA invertase Pin-like site-specific DNA recombinase
MRKTIPSARTQRTSFRNFGNSAKRNDGTVVQEYVDRPTGKHSDREQFQQLFQDASQRKFDVALFRSLDRFSREGVRETLNHLGTAD